MSAARLELRGVGMSYGPSSVLAQIDLRFDRAEMVALAGPNGAGKSTLLGIMSALRPDYTGSCKVYGIEAPRWRRRDFARKVALVPQSLQFDFPFTAEEVVYMGRTPHAGGFFESPRDRAAAREAMEMTDILDFAGRDFRSLSGGERQRVVLASAIAQQPEILLLDEPTSSLDLAHQFSIYALLRRLSASGLLVIAATHDLNLAAAYSDRIVLLRKGRLIADADPCEALSSDRIRGVFGVRGEWLARSSGPPWIAFEELPREPGGGAPTRPAQ
jgi:iron complex transport system ATP-binding protein